MLGDSGNTRQECPFPRLGCPGNRFYSAGAVKETDFREADKSFESISVLTNRRGSLHALRRRAQCD